MAVPLIVGGTALAVPAHVHTPNHCQNLAPPEGEPPPALDIDLSLAIPSTVTEVQIPPELLMPGTEYEFEVLAIEVSGNKTITAGAFFTAGAAP